MSLHGTISRYTNNRCRCEACREAYHAYCVATRDKRNENARDGYYRNHAARRKAANANAKPRTRTQEHNRRRWLRRKYDVAPEEVEVLFSVQNRKCAICGADEGALSDGGRDWHVDHDHVTGRIRGILCLRCNIGIGHLKDDPALLRKALAYLLAASAQNPS